MKAIWNDTVIAEAPREDLIFIEQHWYFPPDSIKPGFFRNSDTPYTCPWKGVCQYVDVGPDNADKWSLDNGWSYPKPMPSAIDRVKKDFSGYTAFWRDVTVTE